ncbi:MAG: Na+/H+ antiporter NhaA [Gemmatimonadota bacterium]|nr:Na+/H+ antiporter NhaA [Gemmatimonadota bacterium]
MDPESSSKRTGVDAPLADRVALPFQEFARAESAGGIVLLACTALAVGWANSPWADTYFHLWELSFSVGFEGAALTKTLHHWINDGLMVVFFFLVGLEIKRELLVGELASSKQAAFPVAGAIGGMVVPALIYSVFNAGGPGARGWAIPMATDIAFALGVLALLGSRVPSGLKIFLAALAIVDDIGAVLVIAIFYTAELSIRSLGAALGILALLFFWNRAQVRSSPVYVLSGIVLWFAVLKSGVHATIAGVVLAMMIPTTTRIDEDVFVRKAQRALDDFGAACDPDATSVMSNPKQQEALHALERSVDQVQSPLLGLEHSLHGVVAFAIMPIFAFANAGVRLSAGMLSTISWRVVLGIVFGLVAGKVLGVTLTALASVRTGIAVQPEEVGWRQIFGVSWLAGIGFTMSLFVANLAFGSGSLLDSAKIGILLASVIAGIVGWSLLRRSAKGDVSRSV